MRSPKVVLDNLASKSNEAKYVYERIYRNLYNIDFYLEAYRKLAPKEGNMTRGTDGKTIDDMSIERIEKIIEKIKDQTYQPNPVRRTYIPKRNSVKLRPLGIPSIDDKLVQEVVRMILESIYEGDFSDYSHGFRPNRSCHTALNQVVNSTGIKWYIEGDIKSFFDNIDHHTLIDILKKRINDEKFINLIWKFLRVGYLEDWSYNNTFSGTPQGGIISPILSNIYLNEFDKFIEEYKKNFDIGKIQKRSSEYRALEFQISKVKKYMDTNWSNLSEEERKSLKNQWMGLKKKQFEIPRANQQDDTFKRLTYVRYADDFLIGIIGSNADALKTKADVAKFLEKNLSIELSQEKTLITHNSEKVRFLSYDIVVVNSDDYKEVKYKDGTSRVKRTIKGIPMVYVPKETWVNKLQEYSALKINMVEGKEVWESTHRTYLKNNDDLEIFARYNAEIRGLYNYYKLATNVSVLAKFHHIMKFSLAKTLGNKYKSSVKKILDRFNVNGEFALRYTTKNGEKICYFYNEGFKKQSLGRKIDITVDTIPNYAKIDGSCSLLKRLKARHCEWCGAENVTIHIHHIKRLKDLKGKASWERRMIERQRKTLALCDECHRKLHAGKLD